LNYADGRGKTISIFFKRDPLSRGKPLQPYGLAHIPLSVAGPL